jgi:hypothetical protein
LKASTLMCKHKLLARVCPMCELEAQHLELIDTTRAKLAENTQVMNAAREKIIALEAVIAYVITDPGIFGSLFLDRIHTELGDGRPDHEYADAALALLRKLQQIGKEAPSP